MIEEVRIESLAYGGDGVGHLADGRVAFVAGSCPGDVCAIDVEDTGNSFVKVKMSSLVETGEARVATPCPEAASGRCGGCPWSHIAYEEQLRCKRQNVVDALTRIGKFDAGVAEKLVAPIVASKKEWGYRNKVEFVVGKDATGKFSLGAHAHAGDFSPISSCLLLPKPFQKIPKALTGGLRFTLGNGEDGGLERIGVRVSKRTNDVEVALWGSPGPFPRSQAAKVISDALKVKKPSVARVLVKSKKNKRKVSGTEVLAGHGCWSEKICDRVMMLSAPSFFQVNTQGAEKLIDLVMEGLQPNGITDALDLYCGAGTFTLPLAEECMNVSAVECEGSSVRDLRKNLERNQLYADVIGGDVGRELPGLGRVDVAVVDPPRSGLAPEALEGLMDTGAKRIAYVSCDPTTLARDLKKIVESGRYVVDCVTPVDLFPQTYHVENVCLLTKAR